MASYYDLLMNSLFPRPAPLQMPSFAPQESTHYKTGLEGLGGGGTTTVYKNDFPFSDVVPPVSLDERNLMGLLNQTQDQTTVQEFPTPETPVDRSYEFKPDQGGYGFKLGEGGYEFKDPNAPAPAPDMNKVWDTMGSDAGKNLGMMNLGAGLLADSLNPKAPQFAPPAPGHRPNAVSIADLMQAYGIRR